MGYACCYQAIHSLNRGEKDEGVYIFRTSGLPESVMEDLRTVVRELIDREDVQAFLVGEQGAFDRQAYRVLREMKEEFPHIRVETVPAYFLREKREGQFVLPEGVECVPP